MNIASKLEGIYSRHETSIYKAWWRDFKQGRGRVEEGWSRETAKLCYIDLNIQNMIMWARRHLKDEPTNCVPLIIHRILLEIPAAKEDIKLLIEDLLGRAESPQEFVKIWWRLVGLKAADFPWLIEE
jgi:hypothetical protein